MKGRVAVAIAIAAAAVTTTPALAADENASCVGILSSTVAQFGVRDDIAHRFNETLHPAGRTVYSHDARFHAGSFPACLAITAG